MASRATDYHIHFHDKTSPRDKVSPIEIELWLERNLRERAKNCKRGSQERIEVFSEMLEKIAASDPIFGPFIDRVLIDVSAERDVPPPEVQALQKLILQEKKLKDVTNEAKALEDEISSLKQQIEEIQHHISRRQKEVVELETTMKEKSEFFAKQRELNEEFNNLFKLFDEPLAKEEVKKERDAPQIISLRLHNQTLRDNVKAMQKMIEIAEEELETIKNLR